MLNNTKIQNPNEQNMKTWNNFVANRLPSCRCEEPKATKQSPKVSNLEHLKFEFV